MRRHDRLPELLAPAGSYEALVAAVNAGADAVYFGGSAFNARINAKNLKTEEIERALLYAHLHGVRAYVTLNTLLYDRERDGFLDFARELYRMGVDAVIVADLGAISLLRRELPELEIHASTQASAHNALGVDALADMGASRVVLARELSLENIRSAVENSSAEIEVFLHGALCVSYSGQCLFSSLVGGRSGNRGECAQACRLPYNSGYPLSLKDMCLAPHIPELIDSGVASLKIEGRMKSPDYVYEVTRIYRTLLDEGRRATADEMSRLLRIFSRDGFTDGYFTGKIRDKMTGMRSEESKRDSRDAAAADTSERRARVSVSARLCMGEPSSLAMSLGDIGVSVTGDVPAAAISAPLTEASVKERLGKLGGTLFEPGDTELELDTGINLSPAKINELRRAAVSALERAVREHRISDNAPNIGEGRALKLTDGTEPSGFHVLSGEKPFRSAMFFSAEQYNAVDTEYFDYTFLPLDELARAEHMPSGVYLPPIVPDSQAEYITKRAAGARELGAEWALCGNISHIAIAKAAGLRIFLDFRFNITNRDTARVLESMGAEHMILSPELTLPQIRDIGCGAPIVFGRIPLMLTERCFMRELGGCKSCTEVKLRDRRGVVFPMLREFEHRNIIVNSRVTYMADIPDTLARYGVHSGHYIFTVEDAGESREYMRRIKSARPIEEPRRIGK